VGGVEVEQPTSSSKATKATIPPPTNKNVRNMKRFPVEMGTFEFGELNKRLEIASRKVWTAERRKSI